MMVEQAEDNDVRVRVRGREMSVAITEEQVEAVKRVARRIVREPFTRRPWTELAFYLVSGGFAGVGLAFVGATMATGVVLAITFVGLAVLALSVRSARGIGAWTRALARSMLGEQIGDPEPFVSRPGFLGWLQSAAARPGGLAVHRLPGREGPVDDRSGSTSPSACGGTRWPASPMPCSRPATRTAPPCSVSCATCSGRATSRSNATGFVHWVAIVISGAVFFFAAPWVMRGFVNVDRMLIRSLLGPDPVATRVRSLEQARTQTVDASAATLRRIERDLHDGTQAQLVALAMRLGMAKEKLEDPAHVDLERVRELVEEAHRGAKEAIAELRDIARGIHPPALDTGPRERAGHPGRPERGADRGVRRPLPASDTGHRGHRLLLRGGAAGERRPARPVRRARRCPARSRARGSGSSCATTDGVAPSSRPSAPRRAGSPA